MPGPPPTGTAAAPAGAGPQLVDAGDGRSDGARLLVWRFVPAMTCVSSGPLGGGLGLRHWVVNVQVGPDYDRLDPGTHLRQIARAAGLDGPGVGLLTAVDVRRWHHASDGGVRVDATVGVTHPIWAASDEEDDHAGGESVPGTINICLLYTSDAADE